VGKRLAVVAVAGVLLLGACGGDGDEAGGTEGADDPTGADGGGDGSDGGHPGGAGSGGADGIGTGGGGGGGRGYSEAVRAAFVASCAAEGMTEEQCACAYEEVRASLPYEDLRAYEEAARRDPSTPPPDELLDARAACV
jgi:hypothetical protein